MKKIFKQVGTTFKAGAKGRKKFSNQFLNKLPHKFLNKRGEFSLFKIFALLVSVPTLIAIIYYSFFASDIYVSDTKFSIYSNKPSNAALQMGSIPQLPAGTVNTETLEQLLMASEFIKSYDMLKKLDSEINLKAIYSNTEADYFSRLSADASKPEFHAYYLDMIKVRVNRDARIIELKAKSFDAEHSLKIVERINHHTEIFINKMLDKVREDSVRKAKGFISEAEENVKNVQQKLSDFRIKHTMLDPVEEVNAKLEVVKTLEQRKAEFLIEKQEKKGFVSNKSIDMAAIEKRIANVNQLRDQIESEILEFSKAKGDLLRQYEMLKLDEKFAKEEYKLALLNLEETIKEQTSMNKYVVEIAEPLKPDIATEPERWYQILRVFVFSFLGFGILILIIASIRDHMD